MTETPVLSLPLLLPSQAQKHVTVNEALMRIDALSQLRLASVRVITPPDPVEEGAVYAVPAGATGDWAGEEGRLALFVNGGWVFVAPRIGWRAMVLDVGEQAIWDGAGWRLGAQTLSPGGAAMSFRTVEIDVELSPGRAVTTATVFPERALAFGVTGRVIEAITGTATTWTLGVAGDTGRYGTGLGVAQGAWVNGPGTPLVYWSPTPLEITASGGDFAAGLIRLVVHFVTLSLPDVS